VLGVEHVEELEQAVALLGRVLDVPVLVPYSLPEGTTLQSRYPLYAYKWGRSEQGALNLRVPLSESERRPGGDGRDFALLTLGYGENYFSMGCGGEKGEPTEVAGEEGLWARSGRTRQVIWPATRRDPAGAYSVYGVDLSADTVRSLAESMEARR
jgi:hypothetical protein